MTHWIQDYIDRVESKAVPVCREQIALIKLVRHAFATEPIIVDEDQLERYMSLQKHFPYALLPWETFLFALHNCVYWKTTRQLRWPNLMVMVGRGAGKNGYLAFEDFALITPVNGIEKYDIDIFANSEDQAKATFDDIYDVLESKKAYFKKYFRWTKTVIENLKTKSKIRYRTSAPRTKDGGRPGKIDFDEKHEYENSRLMDAVITGLGKKPLPRRTEITTQGNVRGGPLDQSLETAEKVLFGGESDDGFLYFICRLDSDYEVEDEEMWHKANPSLYDPNRQELLLELRLEYKEYTKDPAGHRAFVVKRMNRIKGDEETSVTTWDNLVNATRPFPEGLQLDLRNAVFGFDFADTRDFVAMGVLWKVDGVYYFMQHSWLCLQSPSLHRIRFPYREAEERGELTCLDAPEIYPEVPVNWLMEQATKYNIIGGGIDHFRHTLVAKVLEAAGWNADRKNGNVKLTYTPEQARVVPIITRAFQEGRICFGDSMIMRWYTNNACRIMDNKGNMCYGKIEPKSRKTDGFMAFVAAMIVAELRAEELEGVMMSAADLPVFTF